jgi:hypothetical protein
MASISNNLNLLKRVREHHRKQKRKNSSLAAAVAGGGEIIANGKLTAVLPLVDERPPRITPSLSPRGASRRR